jgi:hypothetical protein
VFQADHDPISPLVRELSAKLVTIADEYATRIATMSETDQDRSKVAAGSHTELARRLIGERRLRRRFVSGDLFHEPAWDMLLALYVAHHEERLLNVKALVGTVDTPVTTSQRWIDHLGKLGLVTRVVDSLDRRRIEVSLSAKGLDAMNGYLAALG